MKYYNFSLAVIILFIVTGMLNAQSLEEILKRHFEAVNQEKLKTVQTIIVKGKLNQGGLEIPFTMYQKRPSKLRTEGIFQGMTIVQAVDGEKGWAINPFMGNTEPQVLPPDQIEQFKEQADIDGYFYEYEKKGYKLEMLPDEEVDSIKMNVIKIIKPDSGVITTYFDTEKNVIVISKSKVLVQGVETEMESHFSNYKAVEKILYPFSIVNKMNGQTMLHLTMDSVEFNKEISDSLFNLPEQK